MTSTWAGLPQLNTVHAPKALAMWKRGMDTFDIAKCLSVPEAAVFNTLRRLRESRKAVA
jgi:hypothetical protein